MSNFITAIYAIPTVSDAPSAFSTIEKIAHHLGLLHCDFCNEAPAIAYMGIISATHKQKLQIAAENDNYKLIFIEAEEDTKWIKDETIHIPSNKEMKEHLALGSIINN